MFVNISVNSAIINNMNIKFNDWLNSELKIREWNYSELARRASVSRTSVSDVLSGKYSPGNKFFTGVAKAFKIPVEEVMRHAGYLPKVPAKSEREEKLLYIFDQLPEDQKIVLLEYAGWLLSKIK